MGVDDFCDVGPVGKVGEIDASSPGSRRCEDLLAEYCAQRECYIAFAVHNQIIVRGVRIDGEVAANFACLRNARSRLGEELPEEVCRREAGIGPVRVEMLHVVNQREEEGGRWSGHQRSGVFVRQEDRD